MRVRIFITIIIVQLFVLLALTVALPLHRRPTPEASLRVKNMSRSLMLTDLSLWNESRYTRHPSQADIFSSFQDNPSALEHSPAGSLVAPPPGLRSSKAPGFPETRL